MDSLCLIMIIRNTKNTNKTIDSILKQGKSIGQLLIICDKSEYLYTYNNLKDKYNNNDNILFQLQISSTYGLLLNNCLNYFFKNNFSHLVLINSYDEYYPNFLKLLLRQKKDFVYGTYHAKYATLKTKFKNKKDLLEKYNYLCNSMWTKHAIQKIGYFDNKKDESALLDYYLKKLNIAL